MKRTFLYFLLFSKRILKKPLFLLILISIPFISLWLKNIFTIDNINLKVALYTDDTSKSSYKSINSLLNIDDTITFVKCKSEAELREMVSEGKCQCGYILPANLEKKFDNNSFRHSIKVINGTFTISPVTNEIVFSEVFNNYAVHLLKQYLKENGLFKKRDLSSIYREIDEIYNDYMSGTDAYSFEYNSEENISNDSSILLPGYLILSVRGILAIIILAASLTAGIQLYKDKSDGIFHVLYGFGLHISQFMDILAPTFITGVACFIGIILSGHSGFFYETISLILYILVASLFTFLLCSIINSKTLFCCLIPAIMISCLIICPIFIDISDFNNSFTPLQYIFVPTWYLKLFSA